MTPVIVTAKATGTTMISYSNADMKYMAIAGLITLFFLSVCLLITILHLRKIDHARN